MASILSIAPANELFPGITDFAGSGTLVLAYGQAEMCWGVAISVVSWIALRLALPIELALTICHAWRRIWLIAREL